MKKMRLVLLLLIMLSMIPLSSCSKSEEAQKVDDMIAAIGEVTRDSENAILEAENAYAQLEETDKKALSNYGKLQNARTAYDTICAQEVDGLIDKIGTVTTDSKKDIETVLEKYNGLTENQKNLVGQAERLSELENEYRNAEIKEVEQNIDSIGAVVFTADCRNAIHSARTAYDSLDADQQKEVKNYSTLTNCENEYSVLGIATVEQLIDAIGEVRFGDECGEAIKAAEQASNLLYADQKSQVKNYDVLSEARTKYDTLTPVQLNSYRVVSTYLSSSEFYLNATNMTDKIIKEFTVRIFTYDNDNVPVRVSSYGSDVTQQLRYADALKVGARTKSNAFWYLFVPSKDIKKIVAYVEEVEFYDETTWENPNSDSLYSKYNGKILDENDVNILKRG